MLDKKPSLTKKLRPWQQSFKRRRVVLAQSPMHDGNHSAAGLPEIHTYPSMAQAGHATVQSWQDLEEHLTCFA